MKPVFAALAVLAFAIPFLSYKVSAFSMPSDALVPPLKHPVTSIERVGTGRYEAKAGQCVVEVDLQSRRLYWNAKVVFASGCKP